MAIDADSSLRISLLRFPLNVGIVFIHAYPAVATLSTGSIGNPNPGEIAMFIRYSISQSLTRVAVPLLFLFSAYLFFSHFTFTPKNYLGRISSKARSLGVPFLFWNGFVLLTLMAGRYMGIFSLYYPSGYPSIQTVSYIPSLVSMLLGTHVYPIAFQFWFIRDLILLVLATPLIWFLVKKVGSISLILLFIAWYFRFPLPWRLPILDASFFYFLGAFAARKGVRIGFFDRWGKGALILFILLVCINTVTRQTYMVGYVHRAAIIAGMIGVVYLAGKVRTDMHIYKLLLYLSPSAFFLFATHEPLQKIVRKITFQLFQPHTDWQILFFYFINAFVVITLCVSSYFFLKKHAQSFTSVVTGGR